MLVLLVVGLGALHLLGSNEGDVVAGLSRLRTHKTIPIGGLM